MKKTLLLSGATALLGSLPLSALAQTDRQYDDDEIIVTSSPIAHPEHESIIAATVLTEDELASLGESSIGELLRRQPGISSTFFGPGASRPIIRGQGGPRISVLNAGIGSIDASSVSDDHAVAIEPAMAERVEIVHGAATLFYGSSAAGGVVNVFDGRIPDSVPEGGIDGALRTTYGTVDESIEAAGGFDLLVGKLGDANLVLHGDGFYRETDDYDIPGFAESAVLRAMEAEEGGEEEGEEEAFGIVENSDLETKGGALGASLIFGDGFIGISGQVLRSNYGIPGGHGHEEEEGGEEEGEEEEEVVRIGLRQERFDIRGELNKSFLIFETAKIRFGYADYMHTEFEGDEVGTVFLNEGFEGRLELVERNFGNFRGAVGVQFKHRDFVAEGDEAFTPPNETNQLGIFTVREYENGGLHLQVAGRYEHTDIEAPTVGLERTFDNFSVTAGVGYALSDNLFAGVNALRTERAPSPEELFSDGPHLATDAFEIGDPTLDAETARGVEATFHGDFDRFTFSLDAFYTDYKNYIALIPNGDEVTLDLDGEMLDLPVFEFVSRDAVFKGFEATAKADLFSFGSFDVGANAQVDFVRANFKGGMGDVPRIPALRSIIGVGASSPHFDIGGEVEIAADQDRISEFELPTDGYTLVNFAATWRPGGADHGLSVQVRADNVTNQDARLHSSFLKDVAPLPGRNFRVTLRGAF